MCLLCIYVHVYGVHAYAYMYAFWYLWIHIQIPSENVLPNILFKLSKKFPRTYQLATFRFNHLFGAL